MRSLVLLHSSPSGSSTAVRFLHRDNILPADGGWWSPTTYHRPHGQPSTPSRISRTAAGHRCRLCAVDVAAGARHAAMATPLVRRLALGPAAGRTGSGRGHGTGRPDRLSAGTHHAEPAATAAGVNAGDRWHLPLHAQSDVPGHGPGAAGLGRLAGTSAGAGLHSTGHGLAAACRLGNGLGHQRGRSQPGPGVGPCRAHRPTRDIYQTKPLGVCSKTPRARC